MLIIGNNPGTIVESVMTENLNPSPEIAVADWMTPGVAVFPWWADHSANNDKKTLIEYIDCAAAMGWDVLEFDVSLIESPSPSGSSVDTWLTIDWIKEVVDYAHSKNIKVYGWDVRKKMDTPEKRAFIFGKYNELGLDGIKIDFVDSQTQVANEFREACLQEAAKHRLLVSFHGEYTPRGERRRFPNLMTQEGVLGSEYYTFTNSKTPPDPVHNTTIPFTRNVVGPMDYTPTAYSASKRTSTYAHETALPFVFESGWTAMCDKPEMYLNSPAIAILKEIEASWDEIRFIAGYPGEFIVLARRKADKWIIAGINAEKERTVEVPLTFLDKAKYQWQIGTDPTQDPRNNADVHPLDVSGKNTISVTMAANGGFVIIAKPISTLANVNTEN
jgi:alpha-glucosidase